MALKWLTNDFDPNHEVARLSFPVVVGEDRSRAWESYQEWLKDKIIGEPQGPTVDAVAELKRKGYVGIYINER